MSANTHGTDYICADIHGHFSLLEALLHEAGFDTTHDRLFSLGDLIDRGEESARALEFLHYPWFHAILGNHELMLMNAYESDDPKIYEWWYYWGGDWAKNFRKEHLAAYYETFKLLPLAIELSLKDQSRVALVHAELPSPVSWNTVRRQLQHIPADAAQLEEYLERLGIASMLWAKTQAYSSEKEKTAIQPVQDIDHVFHGHSIVYYRPETITNRTFMDLGSYETGEIGFIDPLGFLQSL